ncbi:MAG: TIGR03905 family TSCPD domain-containing protein [Clostridia bacterium]|jgi:uncharacterized protein (TIGR03905 family)|nr:TIGR03905 family TSCPD domain-containing protein [Clostridia bacterium]
MKLSYKTSGVCSRTITADIEDGKIYNLRFEGGCNGNTKGISALVEGMEINDVIDRLEGIKCGFRGTSCPDQLAQALKSIQS